MAINKKKKRLSTHRYSDGGGILVASMISLWMPLVEDSISNWIDIFDNSNYRSNFLFRDETTLSRHAVNNNKLNKLSTEFKKAGLVLSQVNNMQGDGSPQENASTGMENYLKVSSALLTNNANGNVDFRDFALDTGNYYGNLNDSQLSTLQKNNINATPVSSSNGSLIYSFNFANANGGPLIHGFEGGGGMNMASAITTGLGDSIDNWVLSSSIDDAAVNAAKVPLQAKVNGRVTSNSFDSLMKDWGESSRAKTDWNRYDFQGESSWKRNLKGQVKAVGDGMKAATTSGNWWVGGITSAVSGLANIFGTMLARKTARRAARKLNRLGTALNEIQLKRFIARANTLNNVLNRAIARSFVADGGLLNFGQDMNLFDVGGAIDYANQLEYLKNYRLALLNKANILSGINNVGYIQEPNFNNTIGTYAFGGNLGTNGTNFTDGLTYFNNGGRHEENPNQGVPLGIAPDGLPNLVEEGEVKWNEQEYIFSDRLHASGEFLEKWKLPKTYADKTYAYIVKNAPIVKEAEERPNDPSSQDALDKFLAALSEDLELTKKEKEAADIQEQLSNMSPEELALVNAGLELQQLELLAELIALEQAMAEQAAMQLQAEPLQVPEELGAMPMLPLEPMIGACGGHLHAEGGEMINPEELVVDPSTLIAPLGLIPQEEVPAPEAPLKPERRAAEDMSTRELNAALDEIIQYAKDNKDRQLLREAKSIKKRGSREEKEEFVDETMAEIEEEQQELAMEQLMLAEELTEQAALMQQDLIAQEEANMTATQLEPIAPESLNIMAEGGLLFADGGYKLIRTKEGWRVFKGEEPVGVGYSLDLNRILSGMPYNIATLLLLEYTPATEDEVNIISLVKADLDKANSTSAPVASNVNTNTNATETVPPSAVSAASNTKTTLQPQQKYKITKEGNLWKVEKSDGSYQIKNTEEEALEIVRLSKEKDAKAELLLYLLEVASVTRLPLSAEETARLADNFSKAKLSDESLSPSLFLSQSDAPAKVKTAAKDIQPASVKTTSVANTDNTFAVATDPDVGKPYGYGTMNGFNYYKDGEYDPGYKAFVEGLTDDLIAQLKGTELLKKEGDLYNKFALDRDNPDLITADMLKSTKRGALDGKRGYKHDYAAALYNAYQLLLAAQAAQDGAAPPVNAAAGEDPAADATRVDIPAEEVAGVKPEEAVKPGDPEGPISPKYRIKYNTVDANGVVNTLYHELPDYDSNTTISAIENVYDPTKHSLTPPSMEKPDEDGYFTFVRGEKEALPKKANRLLPTFMRYAPLFDYAEAPTGAAANIIGNSLGNLHWTAAPRHGEYFKYEPVDTLYRVNQLQSDNNAARKGIINLANGNTGMAMANLALQNSKAQALLGETLLGVDTENWNRKKDVINLHNDVDKFYDQLAVDADKANMSNNSLLLQAARDQANILWDAELSQVAARNATRTNRLNNLGAIGRENLAYNQANTNEALRYRAGLDGGSEYKTPYGIDPSLINMGLLTDELLKAMGLTRTRLGAAEGGSITIRRKRRRK